VSLLTLKEFIQLAKKANVIPVYKEISADLDTPVSSFLKLNKDKYAFLLESVEGQEKIARYSFLGSKPSVIFKSKGRNIQIEYQGKKIRINRFVTKADPLNEIEKIMSRFKTAKIQGIARFHGGFVGYIGYDMVRFFEKLPDKNTDDLKIPDAIFILTDTILAFDHINHTIKIIANCILPRGEKTSAKEKIRIYQDAVKKIELIQKDLRKPLSCRITQKAKGIRKIKITSNFAKSEFCGIVNRAKEYIKKGEIIQVVLSQRFNVKINKEPFDIYRDLRSLNPSPYMFFLKLNEITLIGSSPELLVRCEDGVVQTRPIAGTRRRGNSEKEDKSLEKELLNDVKEKAEHLMLVDLGRNDLGRVSKLASVKVDTFMKVERYSHVMHLVSDVIAELDKKYDMYNVLRACFPAGTVSGAPKVRAMEIIDELENIRRGPYAGSVGYFSFSQNMDTCITIRTICVKDNTAYIQAGAGIVADSVAEKEYYETVNKAKALMEALVK
jgi:anthranilate synthase component 1